MQDLKKTISKFEKIVSPKLCNDLAKEVGFVKRSSSRLQGYEFAQALMVPNAFIGAESLNSLAVRMREINNDCDLSASALAQRINSKAAVEFMKRCLERVFNEVVQKEFNNLSDIESLSGFGRVLIHDSTMAELNEKLSSIFEGRSGSASGAALKIDFIFDYLSGQFVDIDFFSGNKPDQSLAGRIIPFLEKDDLIIRDLGYYSLKAIKQVEQASAYYISRFKSNLQVYESEEATEPLDLARHLDNQNKKDGIIDIVVFIGKEKHKVRLVACEMSEEAINKRRRDANRTAQRSGRQTSKKKLNLLKYSIFITNVPVEKLSATSIVVAYRARWRVELTFREWKTCLQLDFFKGYKEERIYCLLYGRLIMILLLGAIASILMQYAFALNRELSCFKLTNYIIADHAFAIALLEGKIDSFIDKLLQDLPRRLCMDKRTRPTLRSNVRQGNGYHNTVKNNDLNIKIA